ncbi:MAG: universal stress protein [Reyranella sp.]|jgi:nucleotide-binding universal stress UspA family protein|uniref:universal stress protein n=1 Tax=Reyranella sp. TaxID=1929291 RepID=UPI000AEC2622|nr:universal stress protein [Reyranella sp.]MBN9539622.1 universal stress protein [Alphaproteobacteria bacterium]MBR2817324.1 universal stress protein [Reyranella sp.]
MKSILTMAWTAEDPSSFDLAAKIARKFGARLIGLEPPSYGVMSMAWADAGMGAPIGGGLAEDAEERQRVAAVKQAFDQRASGLTSEWRTADDSGPTAIGTIGRAYDLIVLPQPGALPKMPESVFETALFDSGRPILVVPPGATDMVGKRILFAWNGSTESARAISLAMPVMAGAEAIEVLSVEGAMVPGPTSAEIAESLRSHGLNVTSQHVKPGAKSAGQTIIDRAQSLGADLIVKGAYTQSRLRQMIFGGVTRDLILSSPLPVLFSY